MASTGSEKDIISEKLAGLAKMMEQLEENIKKMKQLYSDMVKAEVSDKEMEEIKCSLYDLKEPVDKLYEHSKHMHKTFISDLSAAGEKEKKISRSKQENVN